MESPTQSLSVYTPSDFVVDFDAWMKVIIAGLETAVNFAIYVGSEGQNVQALSKAIGDTFQVSADVAQASLESNNVAPDKLQASLTENFNQACRAINADPAWVTSVASAMGYPSGWGLISGADYDQYIHCDKPGLINGGYGWSVFRAPDSATSSPDYIANHAFIQDGHLIYYWDRYTLAEWGGKSQFWLPWTD